MEPIVVYYAHYTDFTFQQSNWNKKKDFAACVMAKNIAHAIVKVERLVAAPIKIIGIAAGKPEWVDENNPIGDMVPKKQPQYIK